MIQKKKKNERKNINKSEISIENDEFQPEKWIFFIPKNVENDKIRWKWENVTKHLVRIRKIYQKMT